jgi:hypothetical protein
MTAKKDFRMIDTKLFLAIANTDITRAGYKVLLIVIHFSMGYHKKEADISTKTFQRMTGLAKTSVLDAVHELENKHILEVIRHSTRKSIYSLNTLFETWKTGSLYPTSLVVKKDAKTLPVSRQNHTKTGSLHATKTGSPVVPKKSTIYIEDKYITIKDNGEGSSTGDTFSFESSNDGNELDNDSAVRLSGAKSIKENDSLESKTTTGDKLDSGDSTHPKPIAVFSRMNHSIATSYRDWEKMAESILGMPVSEAEHRLDRYIDDIHSREDLQAIKNELDKVI